MGQILESFKTAWAEADQSHPPETFVRLIRKELEPLTWPDRGHEDFKYTSLTKYLNPPFMRSKKELFQVESDNDYHTITFINGYMTSKNVDSSIQISECEPDSHFLEKPSTQILSLLNWAQGGKTVHLEVLGPCSKPLLIQYINVGSESQSLIQPRISVALSPHAKITILEDTLDIGGGGGFINKLFMATVAEGAEFIHYRIQNDGYKSTSNGSNQIEVHKDATYKTWHFNLGALLGREVSQIRLLGEGARVDLKGLYLSTEQRQLDQHIEVFHDVKNTFSKQHFKGILRGKSKAVFNGRIFVAKGASGVDARQLNNNLLLSSESEVDTKPELIIENSDVKCSHGATVGQLNPDQIFYLMARGIPAVQAEEMICGAFAEEIILSIENIEIRKKIARACGLVLNQGGPHAPV